MLHGYIWRLTCDQVLAVGTVQARKFLAIYLARGEIALNADAYFGAKLPGRFCPNFAYHFRVANNWPTRPDPLEDLAKLHMVSLRAQEYDPVVIDLHIDEHPEISLLTRDQLSTERHRQANPRFSSVSLDVAPSLGLGTLPAGGLTLPAGVLTRATHPASTVDLTQQAHSAATIFPSLDNSYPPHAGPRFGTSQPSQQPHLPTHAVLYSPPAMPAYLAAPAQLPQPARSLFPPFGVAAQLPVVPAVTVVRTSDPTQATILTAQGRHEASPEFLQCCRLLVHHDTRLQLMDPATGQPLRHQAHLFPRQPTLHFRRDVLGPLYQNLKGYQPSFYNYVEALLSHAGIPVDPTYAQGFFTAERFKTIYSAESWAMTPATQHLISLSAATFNVYSMLQCLPVFHSHPQLLPARGIEVLQTKSIAKMVHLLFAMIDMKPDFATSTLDKSILGIPLRLWSQLPGLIPINSLWNAHPASVTFYWFNSLWELLQIFHCWIKAQRFHQTQGFTTACDTSETNSTCKLTVLRVESRVIITHKFSPIITCSFLTKLHGIVIILFRIN
jgi:hypothetical protein